MAATELQADPWLSEKLGKPAFNLRKGFTEFSLSLLPSSPAFVSAKVATTEHEAYLHLQRQGFRVIDVGLQYRGKPNQFEISKIGQSFRTARNEDEPAVCQIAAEEFLLNRFHEDPEIPLIISSQIKRDWVANFFLGKRGDVLLVATVQDEVCGFLLLIQQGNQFVIDLVAVKSRFQQQGIAKNLICFAWNHHRQSEQEILVGTQISNFASISLYSHLGLELTSANYLLHLHQ